MSQAHEFVAVAERKLLASEPDHRCRQCQGSLIRVEGCLRCGQCGLRGDAPLPAAAAGTHAAALSERKALEEHVQKLNADNAALAEKVRKLEAEKAAAAEAEKHRKRGGK